MAYQISSRSIVLDWLAGETSAERRESFLEWLPELGEDPYRGALPVPGQSLVHSRLVPRCGLAVTFLVAEQFHAVHIISIDNL